MLPEQEFYSAGATGALRFVAAAYACSPPVPSSDEIITDIQVFSDQPFGDGLAVGDDLAALFDVIVLDEDEGFGYQRFALSEFLAQNPNAVNELILVLDAAPATTAAYRFTVNYFQEGSGLDAYTFTTEAVTLKSAE